MTIFSFFGRKFELKMLVAAAALVIFVLSALVAPPSQAAVRVSESSVSVMAAKRSCATSTPIKSRPTLRYGDTGSCVTVMQQLLQQLGYNIGTAQPDGLYYAKTRGAVLKFQSDRKLVKDAVVGPITWGELAKKSAKKPAPSKKTGAAVLTYDDCPYGATVKTTNATLKYAKDIGIHLRIYITGECLKIKKFDVAYARKMGHTVCSHSNNHKNLNTLSYAGVKKEIVIPGLKTDCARPPGGAHNSTVDKVFKDVGYRLDMWTVDTNDWRGKSQSQIVSYVVSNTKQNDVVLMHLQHKAFNKSALKQMKDGLQKRGVAVK